MGNAFTTPSAGPAASAPAFVPPGTFLTAPAGAAAGRYASRQDVEALFGRENVARWSQLDNDATAADPSRIAAALRQADAEIDHALRGGPYALPLSLGADRATIARWAATLAGGWLYAGRGTPTAAAFPYAALLAAVRQEIAACKAGVLRLDSPRLPHQPTGPVAEGVASC